jgi:hypothetical protein
MKMATVLSNKKEKSSKLLIIKMHWHCDNLGFYFIQQINIISGTVSVQ